MLKASTDKPAKPVVPILIPKEPSVPYIPAVATTKLFKAYCVAALPAAAVSLNCIWCVSDKFSKCIPLLVLPFLLNCNCPAPPSNLTILVPEPITPSAV